MNVIQVLILLFIVYVLVGLGLRVKKRDLTSIMFSLLVLFWGIVGFVVIFPEILDKIADVVGVGRGVDVALYVSVLILFYGMYRIYVRLEKIDRSMTELVRKMSINTSEKK